MVSLLYSVGPLTHLVHFPPHCNAHPHGNRCMRALACMCSKSSNIAIQDAGTSRDSWNSNKAGDLRDEYHLK
eukprot:3022141-Amphidinium_carterae.1